MHPLADPKAIVWWVRHPQSLAIEQDTYLGDSELSEKGKRQIKHLAREIRKLKPDLVLCSPMIRTTSVLLETDTFICDRLKTEPSLSEWPRIPDMIGRSNNDPKVGEYLDARAQRFVDGHMLPEEEAVAETEQRMVQISDCLQLEAGLLRARQKVAHTPRIVVVSHGNRGRQFLSWVLTDGNPEQFRTEFLRWYRKGGLEPCGIMGPFWYGKFFRESIPGWNVELGYTRHLPAYLRDSEI